MAFLYYRTVTIDHTKVPSTDQSNFPVLISGTYTYLKTEGNGGKVKNSSGFDIVFYSDAALTTKLDHEIERYVASTGEIIMWVRVSSVSHTTDTVFYMAYGNASISTSQENITGVWDSNYKAVWHLGNGTTLSGTDSTSNGLNGTISTPTAVAGEIDGAASFSSGDGISFTSTNVGTTYTVSFWFKPSSVGGFTSILAGADANNAISAYGSTVLQLDAGTTGQVFSYAWTTSAWWYVTLTRSGTSVSGYDGATLIRSLTLGANNASVFSTIAKAANGQNPYTGLIDELRISTIARSADWIAAEYNNQNSPSTFYTLGSEVANASVIPMFEHIYRQRR